jgi:hypothetical protein
MNRSLFKYIIIVTLVILCSCGSRTYEWVKINPDKVGMSKRSTSYSATVRQVDVKVNIKPKAGRVIYVENSEDYFANPISGTTESFAVAPRKTVKRSHRESKSSKLQVTEVENRHSSSEKDIDINLLNKGLIIPAKKKVKEVNHDGQEAGDSVALSTNLTPGVENMDDTLNHANDLSQLENSNRESAENELRTANDQAVAGNHIKEERSKRNSYMWVGLMLLIVGLIIGLIFGSMAYLISVVGIVFLLIGYFTKV